MTMDGKDRDYQTANNVSPECPVPDDHDYCYLDRSIDLSFVRNLVRDHNSPIGGPSVDRMGLFMLPILRFGLESAGR